MLWVLFRYFLFASASILLLHPYLAGANWPVARYTNGTVGLINDGGEVHVQSAKLQVNGRLKVEGDLSVKGSLSVGSSSLLPPKCMPPGGDKLIYNGTHWFCVCAENWSGETCETPPSPPSETPPFSETPPSPPQNSESSEIPFEEKKLFNISDVNITCSQSVAYDTIGASLGVQCKDIIHVFSKDVDKGLWIEQDTITIDSCTSSMQWAFKNQTIIAGCKNTMFLFTKIQSVSGDVSWTKKYTLTIPQVVSAVTYYDFFNLNSIDIEDNVIGYIGTNRRTKNYVPHNALVFGIFEMVDGSWESKFQYFGEGIYGLFSNSYSSYSSSKSYLLFSADSVQISDKKVYFGVVHEGYTEAYTYLDGHFSTVRVYSRNDKGGWEILQVLQTPECESTVISSPEGKITGGTCNNVHDVGTFGHGISISGDFMAVGSYTGNVYIFRLLHDVWKYHQTVYKELYGLNQEFTPDLGGDWDDNPWYFLSYANPVFGTSVSLLHNTLVIGGLGKAYVYEKDGMGLWQETNIISHYPRILNILCTGGITRQNNAGWNYPVSKSWKFKSAQSNSVSRALKYAVSVAIVNANTIVVANTLGMHYDLRNCSDYNVYYNSAGFTPDGAALIYEKIAP